MYDRVVLTLVVWAFAMLSCVLFVGEAEYGPIVFVIDNAHGIHLGDLVACVGFPAWAFAVTRSFWLPERRDAAPRRR
jgi:hypothetical protein